MHSQLSRFLLPGLALLTAAACATRSGTAHEVEARWSALPDTTLCVVDRTAPRGLRNLDARIDTDGTVLLRSDRRLVPAAELHPVSLVAGYGGSEGWVRRGEPVRLDGRRYVRTGGERRVALELVTRVGDFQGLPLFGAPDERPPEAVYLPLRAGCVFQAYVREDLL
jgi:hypothetical protein